jgi:hypothetical protein
VERDRRYSCLANAVYTKFDRQVVARAARRFERVLAKNSNCVDSAKPLIVS